MGHGGAGGGVASRRALLQRSLRFDLCDCMDCLFSFFPFFWPNDVARGRGGAQEEGPAKLTQFFRETKQHFVTFF